MKLSNKVALVTGAASGLGRAIAETFAGEGAHVIITDLNVEGAKAAAEAIIQRGGSAEGQSMDVSSEEAVNRVFADVIQRHGKIDIAVSNAGIQIISALDELSLADWKKMMAIHLDGAFLVTHAALKSMYPHKSGTIIYIGSVHSKEGSLLKAPYVTAKHGLEGLCKVVAKEGAKYGVRSNLICPGFVRTPMVDKQIPEQAEALGMSQERVIRDVMLKETVDGEFTTLDDIAETALFFASFPTNALTGQSIVVSHGWCMD